MNLLTFVSSLLLVFAITAHMFRSSVIDSKRAHLTYQGYKKAFRKNQSLFQQEIYKRAKKKPPPKSPSIEKKEPKKTFIPQKTESYPECMKFDLSYLTTLEQFEHTKEYAFFVQLLKTLYGNTLLKKMSNFSLKKFASQLIQQLKATIGKEDEFFIQLEKLHHPKNHYLYYRMIKGTQDDRYPSLLNYIKYGSKDSKICISCANKAIISSLFSRKIAEKLLSYKEKETDRIIVPETTFKQIVEEQNFFMDLITFKHTNQSSNARTTLLSQDKKTDIRLQQRVFLFPEN